MHMEIFMNIMEEKKEKPFEKKIKKEKPFEKKHLVVKYKIFRHDVWFV